MATDCDQPIPINCPPVEKYRHITTTNNIGTVLPSCPSQFFPYVLQNHQLMVAKYISHYNRDSLLLWHGLGSGKTMTSIAAAAESNSSVYVFAPASLINNYRDEITTYNTELLKFHNYRQPGHAINVANKFIEKADRPGFLPAPTPKTLMDTKAKINEILDEVGEERRTDIATIIGKIDRATNYDELMDVLTLPGGGTKKRYKKMYNKTKKGGKPNKTNMVLRASTFYFRSTNGDLNTEYTTVLNDIERLPQPKMIVIDESQLFISSLFDKIIDNTIDYVPLRRELDRNTTPYITQTDFDAMECVIRAKTSGVRSTKNNFIYNKLIQLNTAGTRILLLSGTPMVTDAAEIALAVNILSGDKNRICCNRHVFNRNFTILRDLVTVPIYDYAMTNVSRQAHINDIQRLNFNNRVEFIRACKPYVSYFANVDAMMPRLNTNIGYKTVFNNNGNAFINIVECPMTNLQLAYFKYLQYTISDHGEENDILSYVKKRFFDYTFLMDQPTKVIPHITKTAVVGGILSTRAREVTDFVNEYFHTFQMLLDTPPTPGAPGIPPPQPVGIPTVMIPNPNPVLPGTPPAGIAPGTITSANTPKLTQAIGLPPQVGAGPDWEPDYQANSKLFALCNHIRTYPTSKHVIYTNSRITTIMVSRMLQGLGFEQTLNGSDGDPARKQYAFLTGESSDDPPDKNEQKFRYQGNEGNTDDKEPVKRAFNNRTTLPNFNILIIGDSVAEGITLKSVDFIHLFSFPYNLSKMQQIVARVNRNCVFPADAVGNRGNITPLLYLTVTGAVDQAAVTTAGNTIHPGYVAWNAFNQGTDLDVSQITNETTLLVNKIIENDKMLPYLYTLRDESFDKP
jgi:hypothetical protein